MRLPMVRPFTLVVLMVLITSASPAPARELLLGVGGGVVHLDKRTPLVARDTTGVVRIDVGTGLTPISSARFRLEVFPVEGDLNKTFTLAAELRPWRWGGFLMSAGISGIELGRVGHALTGAAVGVIPLTGGIALRGEAGAAWELRNDFQGLRYGLTMGMEFAWR